MVTGSFWQAIERDAWALREMIYGCPSVATEMMTSHGKRLSIWARRSIRRSMNTVPPRLKMTAATISLSISHRIVPAVLEDTTCTLPGCPRMGHFQHQGSFQKSVVLKMTSSQPLHEEMVWNFSCCPIAPARLEASTCGPQGETALPTPGPLRQTWDRRSIAPQTNSGRLSPGLATRFS